MNRVAEIAHDAHCFAVESMLAVKEKRIKPGVLVASDKVGIIEARRTLGELQMAEQIGSLLGCEDARAINCAAYAMDVLLDDLRIYEERLTS